jgi:two-component system LytT family response regulator
MRTLIVDDEDLARAVLAEYLAAHPDIEIVGQCANGFDAVKAITELAPDLVFLDIQMPKLNGFEVVELAGNAPRYIFATAFDQFALKAFEVHAIDYLLKPFNQQRLDQALAHARTSLARPQALAALVEQASSERRPLARVLIRDGAKVHILAADKIDYIEAQDDYVQLRSEGKSYLKNQRLSELEAQLEAHQFLRVHRSYIVNVERISRIEQYAKDSHHAVLHDGTRIPISRSGYQKVRDLVR